MGTANQIPVMPIKLGKISMAALMKIKVRRNDIIADNLPLFKAVNRAEAKMLAPTKRKQTEKMRKPSEAKAYTWVPGGAKMPTTCLPKISAMRKIKREDTPTAPTQILKIRLVWGRLPLP